MFGIRDFARMIGAVRVSSDMTQEHDPGRESADRSAERLSRLELDALALNGKCPEPEERESEDVLFAARFGWPPYP